jgi:polysaccharide biosynthesis protein PslG
MGVFVDLRDDKTAADISGLGLRWVRIMYNWTWLEPSKGHFNWTEFDQWMARAKAKRLRVLAVAQGSPAWANGGHGPYDKQSGLNTPPSPEFYDQFAQYAAGLVRHGADAVEIWNEPNGGFWLPAPNAKAWANLVVRSHDAVKAVNPRIPVITGGVCPLPEGSRNANAPEKFLAAALDGVPGFARKFDGVGHHPYVFANDPAAKDPLTAPYQWNPILQTATMQKTLLRYGAGDKPFWFTEYGVPTGGPFGAVTPEESGTIYRHYYQAFDRLAAQGIKLGPMFFWTLYDILPYQKANTIEGWEGVYDLSGAPKASVAVIKERAGVTSD